MIKKYELLLLYILIESNKHTKTSLLLVTLALIKCRSRHPALKLYYRINPLSELADPGVNPRLIRFRAPNPPRNHTSKYEPLVRPLDHHRSSGVTFAGIKAASPPPRTNKNVRDVLDIARWSVHRFADRVVYHWNGYFLKDTRKGSICKTWKVV